MGKPIIIAAVNLLLLASISTASAQDSPNIKSEMIAVLDLQDKGAGKELASNITDIVTVGINELGIFTVLSRADIRQMLQFEEDKQSLGCEGSASCFAEIGGALGVALLVSGSIGKVGNSYLLNLVLTDTSAAKVIAREQRQIETTEAITEETKGAARFLLRSLLADRQGDLVVDLSESGVTVELDGRIIGVTPLARQTIAGGPHTLKLLKKSFITWARDISVSSGETTVIQAKLVPSMEFINDYDSSAKTWRLLAYITAAVGTVGLVGSIGGYGWNGDRAEEYEVDILTADCGVGGSGTGCQEFHTRSTEIKGFDNLMLMGGVGSALSLAASAYLFSQGPTPGAFDIYKTNTTIAVIPSAGGLKASAIISF